MEKQTFKKGGTMKENKTGTRIPVKLRDRVEEFLQKHPSAIKKIPPNSVRDLFEDLQVYQIELENRNNELLKAHKKLLESQDRFKQLSEVSFEAIAYHKDGILRKANEQYFNMFGYDPDELMGKNAMPLTVAPESIELMKKQVSSNSKETYEAIGLRKNGTRFPIEIRVRQAVYQGDTIRVAIIRDITKSKQAEKALKESENRYRAVVEGQTEMICRFLPDGTLTFVNEAYCRYFDKGREELIGHKFMPLIPESDREKVFENISSLNPNNPIITHEHQVLAHKGELCWHKWTNRAIFDDQNNLMEYQAVGWDITHRKQAEEALRESEARYRTLVETMNEGLEVADENSMVTYINDRLSEMIGYSPDETIGRPIYDFIDETYHELVREIISERKSGEGRSYELVLKSKDNQKVYTIMSPSPIFDAKGQFRGSFGVMTNITERKQTENALRESEEKYRRLFSTVSDAVMVIDAETREFLDVNKAASSIYGYSKEEFL
jgi:PAS domain S-box-containing protein